MRKISFVLVFLLLAALLPVRMRYTAAAAAKGRAECVVEVSSRRFLHEENAEARLPMASTTKILTAIVIIEDCPLTDTVKIPAAAAGTEGSTTAGASRHSRGR